MNTFDPLNLTKYQKSVLESFFKRRQIFDDFLKGKRTENRFTCPCCGYPSLSERRAYVICRLCNWEDDGQDDPEADLVFGGPNMEFSLTERRILFGEELDESANRMGGKINLNAEEVINIINNNRIDLKRQIQENLERENIDQRIIDTFNSKWKTLIDCLMTL